MSKTFAQNLRFYRTNLGITQQELAARAGVTRNAIANYESGRTEPSFEALCIFCRELGLDADQLLTEQDHTTPYISTRQVTEDEIALLDAYREADEVYQAVAKKRGGKNPLPKGVPHGYYLLNH